MTVGPYETEQDARAAIGLRALPPDVQGTQANLAMLKDACAVAGVELGAYDQRILEWLAGYEPQMCAVVAGLVYRAFGYPLAAESPA